MSEQAKQVFYEQDPCNSTLSVVLQGRPIGINHQNDDSILDICEMPAFSTKIPSITEENEVDEVYANCNDHDEGLWENTHM